MTSWPILFLSLYLDQWLGQGCPALPSVWSATKFWCAHWPKDAHCPCLLVFTESYLLFYSNERSGRERDRGGGRHNKPDWPWSKGGMLDLLHHLYHPSSWKRFCSQGPSSIIFVKKWYKGVDYGKLSVCHHRTRIKCPWNQTCPVLGVIHKWSFRKPIKQLKMDWLDLVW